ncbi:MAG: hypothetical protein ABSE47_01695 [Acidimicrobiales bacterium]
MTARTESGGPTSARRRALGQRHGLRRVPGRMLLAVGLPALLFLAAIPAQSSAESLARRAVTSTISTLDARASTTGAIVIGTNGSAYVAWEHPSSGPATIRFCVILPGGTCKHAITLPIPSNPDKGWAVTQPFPILGGKAGVVYVVGPRYVPDDSIIWTSTDGGASFSRGYVLANSYVGETNVDDVLRIADPHPTKDFFAVGSNNPGLGFSTTTTLYVKCNVCSLSFGAGGVAGGTLGILAGRAVEAFWNDASPPMVDYYWSPTDDMPEAGAWYGPIAVSKGIGARLTSGPKGMFLLSQDFAGHEPQATRLDVRKWNAATHRFGPAVTVVDDTSSSGSDAIGGFGEDSLTGALYVAWVGSSSKGDVVRVWISTDGGLKWSKATDVAKVDGTSAGPIRIAARDGKGFLTFEDVAGLHLVDLSHL